MSSSDVSVVAGQVDTTLAAPLAGMRHDRKGETKSTWTSWLNLKGFMLPRDLDPTSSNYNYADPAGICMATGVSTQEILDAIHALVEKKKSRREEFEKYMRAKEEAEKKQ